MSPDEEQSDKAPKTEAPAAPSSDAPAAPAPAATAASAPAAPAPAATAASAPAASAGSAERPAGGERRPEAPRRDREPRGRDDDRGGGGRRYFGRRKVCTFCVDKADSVDYKDPGKLRRYVSDRGRIETRRRTGTCAKHQRWLATALKRARHWALLPYSPEHIRLSGTFTSRR